jgi:DNA-binding transcriptional regulator YdaS (Cro superfamily)
MDLKTYLHNYSTQAALAARLKVTQGLVHQWISGRTRITAERCLDIERATGGVVTRYELRPDVFDVPPSRVRRKKRAEAPV